MLVSIPSSAMLVAPTAASPAAPPVAPASAAQTIAVFASDRNGVRQAEIGQLEEICRDGQTSDEIRLAAQRRILQLREWMEKEAVIADVLQ